MVNNNQMEEILQELQEDMLHPELVQDNMLHFHIKEQVYRVVMPTQKQLAEANAIKNKKYFQLIQLKNDDGSSMYLMEKSLIKLLKDCQGIDISEMNKQIDDLEKKLIDKYLSLAKVKDTDIKTIEKLKKEKDEIKEDRLKLVLTKAEYLSPSIQNQVNDEYYRFLTAICTEYYIEENDKGTWKRMWSSFDEYDKDNTNIPYVCLGRLTELMINA